MSKKPHSPVKTFDDLTRAQQRAVGDYVSKKLREEGRFNSGEFVKECQKIAGTPEMVGLIVEIEAVAAKIGKLER